MSIEWLSVKEISERLKIQPASVRMKAKRANWPRKKNNEGTMIYSVDFEDPKIKKTLGQKNTIAADTSQIRHIDETLKNSHATVTLQMQGRIDFLEAQIEIKDRQLADATREKKELLELSKSPSLFKRIFG